MRKQERLSLSCISSLSAWFSLHKLGLHGLGWVELVYVMLN
jgi:hypothetical protein